MSAFIRLFEHQGYTACEAARLEAGFEKIALFIGRNGEPTHAARQLQDGRWTSKLGEGEDISHALADLKGDIYGTVAQIMRRVRAA